MTQRLTQAGDSIGEASEPPPVSPSHAPPEAEFEFGLEPSGNVCAFGLVGMCLGG